MTNHSTIGSLGRSTVNNSQKIKTMIFDMGNVLINFSHEQASRQIAKLAKQTPEFVYDILFKSGLEMEYEAGKITREALATKLESQFKCPLNIDQLIHASCDMFSEKPDMVALAKSAKNNGYRMVLLSNLSQDHHQHIETNYEFLNLFDDLVLSYRVGACKPEPEIYRRAIMSAQCAPSECVFIDDMEINVTAAREHGIQALHYTGTEILIQELAALGVLLETRDESK